MMLIDRSESGSYLNKLFVPWEGQKNSWVLGEAFPATKLLFRLSSAVSLKFKGTAEDTSKQLCDPAVFHMFYSLFKL